MKNNNEIQNYFLTLTKTNRMLKSYVDWEKVELNTKIHKMNLSQLNMLTKAKNLDDIKDYVNQLFNAGRSDAFNSLEILIAKRENKKDHKDREYVDEASLEIKEYNFKTPKEVINFIYQTDLITLFKNVNNLEDYVFGVEVGLDVNARKNRNGKIMEYTIRRILKKHNIDFQEQVHLENIKELSINEKKIKRVDFIFNKNNKTYLIESSFYNVGGSKISEVCNSYVDFTNKLNNKFKMIWVADGNGMTTIKRLLKEQWENISILNIKQFEAMLDE